MTNYNIDIVSDTICPWCYVGKKRLEQAIAQHHAAHPSDTFTTTWHPFYLNPDAPASIDKQAYYHSKFGAQRTKVMQAHLARLGAQVGIGFAFGGKTGNTRDSHRLIALAAAHGPAAQNAVVDNLFRAYFEANEDITAREVLIAQGVRAGLDEGEVRAWMESGSGGDQVDGEVARAQRGAIGGVPSFTVNGTFEVQGAEEPATFLRIFEEVKESDATTLADVLGRAGVAKGVNAC